MRAVFNGYVFGRCNRMILATVLSAGAVFATVGCQSFSGSSCESGCESESVCQSGCGDGSCGTTCQEKPKRWSPEWYATKNGPKMSRQIHRFGQAWPPYERPTGEREQFSSRFHTSHYWPHPYNCQDRQYLQDVSELQTVAGWTNETTLYEYHFDEKRQELNHAGRLHLKWILHTIPQKRRLVWVQMADRQVISQQRLANVRTVAVDMVGEELLPPMALRMTSPTGRPAEEINIIRTKELESIPIPRLPLEGSDGGAADAAQ